VGHDCAKARIRSLGRRRLVGDIDTSDSNHGIDVQSLALGQLSKSKTAPKEIPMHTSPNNAMALRSIVDIVEPLLARGFAQIGFGEWKVSLLIYDSKGRMVRKLVRPEKAMLPGKYRLIWDAKNEGGFEVPSGQYFYRLTAGRYVKTRKMILVK